MPSTKTGDWLTFWYTI